MPFRENERVFKRVNRFLFSKNTCLHLEWRFLKRLTKRFTFRIWIS